MQAAVVQVDESSPYVREWALWAIRNLCAGNERAQSELASLQPMQVVQTEEMQRMGLDLRLDSITRKLVGSGSLQ